MTTDVIIEVPFLMWLFQLFHKAGISPILSPELQHNKSQLCSEGKPMTEGQQSS